MTEVGLVVVEAQAVREEGAEAVAARAAVALEARGAAIRERLCAPADAEALAELLAHLADRARLPAVLTVGGTGLRADDVAPEALAQVARRPVPGLAQALHARLGARDPRLLLLRTVAGVRGSTLLVALPEQPAALDACLDLLAAVLPAAVAQLRADPQAAQLRLL